MRLSGAPPACPTCFETLFEKRGTRRTYHPLLPDLSLDTWNEGDVELDTFGDGEEVIYCIACESEWREADLRKTGDEEE